MADLWKEIRAEDLDRRLGAGESPVLVDVRTLPEVAAYHIPGIAWIPLDQLSHRFGELDPERETVLICEHGVRSTVACQFLHAQGFRNLVNMIGGMSVWPGPVERGRPAAPEEGRGGPGPTASPAHGTEVRPSSPRAGRGT